MSLYEDAPKKINYKFISWIILLIFSSAIAIAYIRSRPDSSDSELEHTKTITPPISEDEIKLEYKKFASENITQEYLAKHILVKSEKEAVAIIAQLNKGAKFEDIAKKHSLDKGTAQKGGRLDWGPSENYILTFATALRKLQIGETTESPIQTEFGFHVIRLDDTRFTSPPKYEDVRNNLETRLKLRKGIPLN